MDKVRRTRLGKGSKLFAIPSVPCFEFWLLLHFTYTSRPFDAPAGDSICSRVIEELRKELPEYEKGNRDIFKTIQDKLDDAIIYARRLEHFHQTSGTNNPFTMMHSLVEYLRGLQRE
jgi:hypothetical protein